MSPSLRFPDPQAAADVLTFARRATRLGDGAVRLRADGGVLALSSAPLAPRTLLEAVPTVLGMRFLPVDPELVCDLTVDAGALAEGTQPHTVRLPDTSVTAPWAGISPPRGGWTDAGALPASLLASRAQWGIAAVAEQVPTDAGDDAVHRVRSLVWGAADEGLGGIPLGAAFAAFALGFIAGDELAAVRRSGAWTRVSLTRGHVLVRTAGPPGLTAVRRTGASR